MNLIDAVYIHEAGGKELLNILIEKTKNFNTIYLLDSRIKIDDKYLNSIKYFKIKPSESNRKKFYLKNKEKLNTVLCFSNVPPPIILNCKVYIYFHNDLLLSTNGFKTSIFSKIMFLIKRNYILFKNQHNYEWIVQTRLIKSKLKKFIRGKNKIIIYPIFRNIILNNETERPNNSYLCISNHNDHKNIYRLLKAFKLYSKNDNVRINLNLTINEDHFKKYFDNIVPKNGSVNIINHGQINKEGINKLYLKNKYYIYPSLKESLGITLIEAAQYKCKIICSDLDYTYEVVSPSLVFNPYSIDSIYNSIKSSQKHDKLPLTKLIIKNKIDKFIEYIYH